MRRETQRIDVGDTVHIVSPVLRYWWAGIVVDRRRRWFRYQYRVRVDPHADWYPAHDVYPREESD